MDNELLEHLNAYYDLTHQDTDGTMHYRLKKYLHLVSKESQIVPCPPPPPPSEEFLENIEKMRQRIEMKKRIAKVLFCDVVGKNCNFEKTKRKLKKGHVQDNVIFLEKVNL
jgi:hypothetical protein